MGLFEISLVSFTFYVVNTVVIYATLPFTTTYTTAVLDTDKEAELVMTRTGLAVCVISNDVVKKEARVSKKTGNVKPPKESKKVKRTYYAIRTSWTFMTAPANIIIWCLRTLYALMTIPIFNPEEVIVDGADAENESALVLTNESSTPNSWLLDVEGK